jgi:heme/copper-type cytochrome/quinol oxidase subunit 4
MKKLVYAALSFAPVLAFAQDAGATANKLKGVTDSIKTLIGAIIPIIFGIAIIYFFWGLITFLKSAGDPKAQEAGKSHMIWGIIVLVIMVAVYGIINWVTQTTGINSDKSITLPGVPTSQTQ